MAGRCRLKKSIFQNAIAIAFAAFVPMAFVLQSQNVQAAAEKPGGVFYRFTTKFIHDGDEELVFDTVVACSVKVTGGVLTGRSYLNKLNPSSFVQRTRGNHAVMVTSPRICSWANRGQLHELRENHLPIVVWFDDADDLSRGEALVSMDAYEAPGSPLKFVSSKIGPADYDDWIEHRKTGPKNIADPDLLHPSLLDPPERWQRYDAFDPSNPKPKFVVMTCYGYARLKIAEADRAKIRKFWPAHRPKYWVPKGDTRAKEFRQTARREVKYIGTVPGEWELKHFWRHTDEQKFAVASRNGQSGTEYRKEPRYRSFPAEYYPAFRNDLFPFITPEIAQGSEYTWDIRSGVNRLGCASRHPYNYGTGYREYYFNTTKPVGRGKPIKLTVDGVPVHTTDIQTLRFDFFVEEDTHLFARASVSVQ